MKCNLKDLLESSEIKRCNFFTGVPDSLLKSFILKLNNSKNIIHIPALNEAHSIGIAYGAMLAKKNSCVYLQNSGLGNIINPLTSLCIPSKIYPFLVVGHRHTLEQHKIMGEIDDNLLRLIGYPDDRYLIVSGDNNVK